MNKRGALCFLHCAKYRQSALIKDDEIGRECGMIGKNAKRTRKFSCKTWRQQTRWRGWEDNSIMNPTQIDYTDTDRIHWAGSCLRPSRFFKPHEIS